MNKTQTGEQRLCPFNAVTGTYTRGYAAVGIFLKSFIFERDLNSNKDNLTAFLPFPWFRAMNHLSRAAPGLQSPREPPHATLLGIPPASSAPAPIPSGAEWLRLPWTGVLGEGLPGGLVLHFERLLWAWPPLANWALQLLLY